MLAVSFLLLGRFVCFIAELPERESSLGRVMTLPFSLMLLQRHLESPWTFQYSDLPLPQSAVPVTVEYFCIFGIWLVVIGPVSPMTPDEGKFLGLGLGLAAVKPQLEGWNFSIIVDNTIFLFHSTTHSFQSYFYRPVAPSHFDRHI